MDGLQHFLIRPCAVRNLFLSSFSFRASSRVNSKSYPIGNIENSLYMTIYIYYIWPVLSWCIIFWTVHSITFYKAQKYSPFQYSAKLTNCHCFSPLQVHTSTSKSKLSLFRLWYWLFALLFSNLWSIVFFHVESFVTDNNAHASKGSRKSTIFWNWFLSTYVHPGFRQN